MPLHHNKAMEIGRIRENVPVGPKSNGNGWRCFTVGRMVGGGRGFRHLTERKTLRSDPWETDFG